MTSVLSEQRGEEHCGAILCKPDASAIQACPELSGPPAFMQHPGAQMAKGRAWRTMEPPQQHKPRVSLVALHIFPWQHWLLKLKRSPSDMWTVKGRSESVSPLQLATEHVLVQGDICPTHSKHRLSGPEQGRDLRREHCNRRQKMLPAPSVVPKVERSYHWHLLLGHYQRCGSHSLQRLPGIWNSRMSTASLLPPTSRVSNTQASFEPRASQYSSYRIGHLKPKFITIK